eukprot:Cvel_27776.t1-p1 / transcript=Cvel_27776.t1 / gene=Cvel_27776 / organism=Chromera_velia_CCMP2878 / gene_product=hypothetical protein / transcript_product=hypothetical protein / location=Cvel_scaffold3523:1-1295(-) / protein_length=243 / sequence_SO=supercontig / SO=protein_coding / is_pseudo=false
MRRASLILVVFAVATKDFSTAEDAPCDVNPALKALSVEGPERIDGSSFLSISETAVATKERFTPQQQAQCGDEVLNLVEGLRLVAQTSGPSARSLTTEPEADDAAGARVVAWADPFYASPIFVEEGDGGEGAEGEGGTTKGGPLITQRREGNEGDPSSSVEAFLHFSRGRHLRSVSDCTPLAVAPGGSGSRGLTLGFFVDPEVLREGATTVLLDNGKGLRVGFEDGGEGRAQFGVLSASPDAE